MEKQFSTNFRILGNAKAEFELNGFNLLLLHKSFGTFVKLNPHLTQPLHSEFVCVDTMGLNDLLMHL
ncbi:MAG: hypothetical protein IPM92_01960 [Saprospiraceae bacterium]|nr:hypothetical protein [Saprospiraceae bacterium]